MSILSWRFFRQKTIKKNGTLPYKAYSSTYIIFSLPDFDVTGTLDLMSEKKRKHMWLQYPVTQHPTSPKTLPPGINIGSIRSDTDLIRIKSDNTKNWIDFLKYPEENKHMIHSILFVSHFQNIFELFSKLIYIRHFVIHVAVLRACRFTTLLDQVHFNFNVILNKGNWIRKSDHIEKSDRIESKIWSYRIGKKSSDVDPCLSSTSSASQQIPQKRDTDTLHVVFFFFFFPHEISFLDYDIPQTSDSSFLFL